MEKIRVFEMFAGYGGASFGLKKAGINHEVVGFSEIDKFADQCWKQNHGDNVKNWGDCTKINPNELPDFDLLTGGFPCQAFSVAGKSQGVDDEKGRGLLFNDIIRIAEVKKPKYMLLENVKGLLGKKHKDFFEFTKSELTRLGYSFDVRVYKSSDYGTPQSRERVFYVCMLGGLNDFVYNEPQKSNLKFLPFELMELHLEGSKYFRSDKLMKWIFDRQSRTHFAKMFNDYLEKPIPTITASKSWLDNHIYKEHNGKYRYLSPTEVFRFMGFFNDEINLEGLSDTQKYKLAGNGWDINLVSQIFTQMFINTENIR